MKETNGEKFYEELISLPYVKYSIRILKSVFNWMNIIFFIVITLIIYYSLPVYLLALVTLFLIFYVIKNISMSNIYIIRIILSGTEIEINYYYKNKGPILRKFPVDSLLINYYDPVQGMTGPRLVIFNEDSKIIQYAIGDWNRNIIQNVYYKIKEIKSH